ncbi:SRPBCC family protein [Actinokineospora enzanensis]|uniref:SRPBCC family protein n=1 Tax=Actinokineospora enzanensis TaxID=155975 RepID=UPI0004755EB0|nr:SRPBCC family protein [Actinokineospora enzanensis]
MMDIAAQIAAVTRAVQQTGESVGVLLTRRYRADAADVWDAITDPDRVARWFLPLSGDLRPGGTFQLEGNAGGDILHCEPPTLLRVTFGGPTSVVEVRLSTHGDETELVLEHTVPIELAGGAAGSLYVGPGWDGAVLALGLYLAGEVIDDPVAAGNSAEAQQFSLASIEAWTAVAAETASAEEVAAARAAAVAQFSPDLNAS